MKFGLSAPRFRAKNLFFAFLCGSLQEFLPGLGAWISKIMRNCLFWDNSARKIILFSFTRQQYFRIKLLSYSAWKRSIGTCGAWFRRCSRYYNERRFHESLDNLTPRDVYLGQGEKIKNIRETIKQNSINKRIFDNKTMKYQSK